MHEKKNEKFVMEIAIIKKKKNPGVEKYNNWTEEFNREF